MKKSYLVGLALCALCAVGIFTYGNRERTMIEICPAAANGEYRNATFSWYALSGNDNEDTCPAALSGEELRETFSGARLKKGPKTDKAPDISIEMDLWDGDATYSIVVGADNTVSIAEAEDLKGSRTFWVDTDGILFDTLYRLHRENGGRNVP